MTAPTPEKVRMLTVRSFTGSLYFDGLNFDLLKLKILFAFILIHDTAPTTRCLASISTNTDFLMSLTHMCTITFARQIPVGFPEL